MPRIAAVARGRSASACPMQVPGVGVRSITNHHELEMDLVVVCTDVYYLSPKGSCASTMRSPCSCLHRRWICQFGTRNAQFSFNALRNRKVLSCRAELWYLFNALEWVSQAQNQALQAFCCIAEPPNLGLGTYKLFRMALSGFCFFRLLIFDCDGRTWVRRLLFQALESSCR